MKLAEPRPAVRDNAVRGHGPVRPRHRVAVTVGMLVVLITLWLAYLGVGAVAIHPLVSLRTVLEGVVPGIELTWLPQPSGIEQSVIWEMRMPRSVLAVVAGGGLALCGLAAQALLRNILADPYILGISSGASTGAAVVMVLGVGFALTSPSAAIALGAFIGCVVSVLLVFTLSGLGKNPSTSRVVFAGLAVNFFFSALTSLLIMLAKNPSTTKSVMFWMLGSFSATRWSEVGIATACVLAGSILLYSNGRRIDAMTLGDDAARGLGVNPGQARILVFILISIIVAALVSMSGTIGFVGLVVPHIAKKFAGGIFRSAFFLCVTTGAILMLGADLLARILVAPGELSVGIITALVGTPLLMSLVHRNAVKDV